MRITSIALAAGVAVCTAPAFAQDYPSTEQPVTPAPAPIGERDLNDDEMRMPAPAPAQPTTPQVVIAPEPETSSGLFNTEKEGILGTPLAVQLGVGQGDFFGENSREATEWGATYEARGILAPRSPIGLEAAYVGSARGLDGFNVDEDASLVSNGLEGALRLAAPIMQGPVDFAPFIFGGLGWEHYTLVGEGNAATGIQNDDSLLTVPLGVGVDLGYGPLNLSARGTYKQAFDAEMFGSSDDGFTDDNNMNTWNVGLQAGFAF